MNCVTLIGNLGRDPEVRELPSGGKCVNLALATTERWKDRETGEKREATEWHRVAIFGPLADVAERYLAKGAKLMVQGQIRTRKWQDQSGQDRYSTEVVLSGPRAQMEMLGGGGDRAEKPAAGYAQKGAYQPKGGGDDLDDLDDSIPF